MTLDIVRRNVSDHADYPHTAGTLYDCTACESNCFCKEINEGQIIDAEDTEPDVCVHCEIGQEQMAARVERKYGRRSPAA